MPTFTASTAQTVLLVSVAVFLVTGLISFGWLLIYGLRKWREEQNPPAEQPAQTPKSEAAAPTPNANPATPVLNAVGDFFKRAFSGGGSQASAPGAHEVLRVARDNLTGRLLVEVAGQRFAKLSDIQDAQLAQAILTTLRDLQEFAGSSETTPSITPLPPIQTAPPTTTAPAPSAPPVIFAAPPPRPAVPTTSAEMPPIPRPSMNPFKQAQVLRERAKQLEPIQLKSIPEIIDEHLQQKLLNTPHTRRGIRVSGNAQGAVVFEMDGRMYDAVEAVPDEEVRNLIKSAIAEWDSKK